MKTIDQEVRDLAVQNLDVSMTLSAGAGTGKTTTLVRRVLNLLMSGAEPDRIAVVTFTTKATRELQERVHDGLERARSEAMGDKRTKIEALQARLGELHVSTIHAFCRMLLRWEALDAGWSPNTELVDEAISGDTIGDAYTAWREQFNSDHPDHARALRKHGNERTLRDAAMAIVTNRDLTPHVGSDTPDWAGALESLRPILADITRLFAECTDHEDKRAVNNMELIEFAASADGLDAEEAVTTALSINTNLRGGSKNNWRGDAKDEFGDAVKAFKAWQKSNKNIEFGPVHTALVKHITEHFVPAVQALKLERGQADFQDLLFGVKDLLRRSDDARERLHARFDAILVDEVQDTDPIQSELLTLLTRAPHVDGDWDAHPPQPGSLFAVGDPKQSIYRFRRADVDQWRALSDLVASAGESRSLRQNFRSVPGLIDWVNHTFAEMPGYESIVASRPPAELDPVVSINHDKELDASVLMASYILDLVRGEKQIADPETDELRPVTWGDIMVLIPAWSKAEELRDTLLRADVPATVEGGKQFFNRDEIKLSLAALRALADPGDSEAVVFVLRGLFGLSADQLATHRVDEGSWRYTITDQPQGPVADALKVLRDLHFERGERSWTVTLDDLLETTQSRAIWSLTPRASAIQANLLKLRALVRKCEDAAKSPTEAIRLLASVARYDDDKDVSIVDDDSNEVSIMTHFGAKGLEAPVVIMPFPERRPDYSPTVVVDRDTGTMGVSAGSNFKSPNWDAWKEQDRAEQEAERDRWMYVAATRARDQFVFFVNEDASSAFSLVVPHLNRGRDGTRHPDGRVEVTDGVFLREIPGESLPEVAFATETFPGHDDRIDELLAQEASGDEDPLDAWRRVREDHVRRSVQGSKRWTSATELARKDVRRRNQPERLDVAVGTAIHRVMEHVDLNASKDALRQRAETLLATIAEEEELHGEFVDKAGAVLEQMLENPVFDRVREAPEHWKEVPFAYTERGRIVAGYIDLVFPVDAERTRWVVVDWKTDRPEEPQIRAAYLEQIEYYARALAKNVTGVEPEQVEQMLVGPYDAIEEG